MKTLIFDIDDTLIKWQDEFIGALKHVLKEMHYNFSEELILKIDSAINEHEHHYPKLFKNELLNFINTTCNIDISKDFVDKLIEAQSYCTYEDLELISTIKYLSSKYELYAISNWFTQTQTKRLERMGILKYFKKVYGADINYFKPHIKTFEVILKDYDAKNCISIGDNLKNDVLLPIFLGMDAIWLDKNNSGSKKTHYKIIKNIYELKNIL